MKQELVQLQPKLEQAKLDNASVMKVNLYKCSFVFSSVRMCLPELYNFTSIIINFAKEFLIIPYATSSVFQLIVDKL